ncbi:MAG TPA: RDD family protein [Thermoleophilaceae bacterium]|nr:RDD family protein [Thermoleophilaceae bacterium]
MNEVAGRVRTAARAHHAAEAEAAPLPRTPEYEGLVTRAIAFALDAAIISGVSVVVGAAAGLTLSVLSVPSDVEAAVFGFAGGICLLWTTAYFVTFWSATGQTPGNRLLGIRVCVAADGSTLRPARALLRLIALTLCAIPLFAGFLPILVNDRRRGAHDMLAGTVVVGAADQVAVDEASAPAIRNR